MFNIPSSRKRGGRGQEKRLAKQLDGMLTPVSGALGIKGDIHTQEEMVEAKATSKTRFVLKLDDLLKAEQQAMASGKRMVFIVELNSDVNLPFINRTFVIIPYVDYLMLRERK